ncbi:molybdopterin-synthase adenylyltransferase MoeB [Pedobacter mucosus]|uniref:molybdopterin-synthase adenylyltransferase MoeB n=1 Tax=Pedobacter mucosus TaxID=2895286 RepID=UPI001EE3F0E9|nr:molybdopterin-synthase adenylyltransferase MoeB [Pedobacter mucosus]UKT62253.1 molybdopterin-synthase adenylyltransferase MoeB [Pedobacter mucosus]
MENLFSKEELKRYNRHIIIPDFGLEAQTKLKQARVLVVGAGGLGSPVLLYLAAAGIGNIGIVDFDVVDDSNLQRQVLYGIEEIGTLKIEAAKARLQSLNPHINIAVYNTHLHSKNALEIVKDYDVVADGTDNFPTRYLVNDACVLLGKTNVYASIYQFEGQVSVFNHLELDGTRGPNYRDLYPTPPEPGLVANCSEAGVLGILPGIIGSMQALEVIKAITGIGENLSGKLFTFDALSFESRKFNVKKNPKNPISGEHPTIFELIDYEQFCGSKVIDLPVKQVSPEELYNWQTEGENIQLIDVREDFEFEIVNIGGKNISLSRIAASADEIATDKKVVMICKSGVRSIKAIKLLEEQYNFKNLYNLEGGLMTYISDLELDLPTY